MWPFDRHDHSIAEIYGEMQFMTRGGAECGPCGPRSVFPVHFWVGDVRAEARTLHFCWMGRCRG